MSSPDRPDGRHARTDEGRRKVGEALVDLVREHGTLPDVATVAARAGVSRRTVFRYFDGKGALELETARQMRARLTTLHPLPVPRGDRERRLADLLDHRAALYEWVTPVRRLLDAVAVAGHAEVAAFVDHAHVLLGDHLAAMLAPELQGRPDLRLPLHVATSWEAWQVLRRGHGLDVEDARATVARMVRALLDAPAA